jgi:hypothetical protein
MGESEGLMADLSISTAITPIIRIMDENPEATPYELAHLLLHRLGVCRIDDGGLLNFEPCYRGKLRLANNFLPVILRQMEGCHECKRLKPSIQRRTFKIDVEPFMVTRVGKSFAS